MIEGDLTDQISEGVTDRSRSGPRKITGEEGEKRDQNGQVRVFKIGSGLFHLLVGLIGEEDWTSPELLHAGNEGGAPPL